MKQKKKNKDMKQAYLTMKKEKRFERVVEDEGMQTPQVLIILFFQQALFLGFFYAYIRSWFTIAVSLGLIASFIEFVWIMLLMDYFSNRKVYYREIKIEKFK